MSRWCHSVHGYAVLTVTSLGRALAIIYLDLPGWLSATKETPLEHIVTRALTDPDRIPPRPWRLLLYFIPVGFWLDMQYWFENFVLLVYSSFLNWYYVVSIYTYMVQTSLLIPLHSMLYTFQEGSGRTCKAKFKRIESHSACLPKSSNVLQSGKKMSRLTHV